MKLRMVRDMSGELWLFSFDPMPVKNIKAGYWIGSLESRLSRNLFPQVKWTDPEPTEVEIKIKERK